MIKKRVLPLTLFIVIMLFAFSIAFSASAAPDDFEIPPYPAPAGEPVTMEYVASYLLQSTGLKTSQLGVYPRDHISMAGSVGLFEGVDFVQGAECSDEDYLKMATNSLPLFKAMNAAPMAPFFYDGAAQPIFDYNETVTFVVYVESNYDTDADGKLDLIKAIIQLPKSALEGQKFSSVFESYPYASGTNPDNDIVLAEAPPGSTFDLNSLYSQPPARVPAGLATTADHAQAADSRDWIYYYGTAATGNANMYSTRRSFDYYLTRGFAVVQSTGRGTQQSEGITTCGSDVEIDSLQVIIDWLNGDAKAYTNKTDNIEIKADWSNGNVGMTGTSYGGTTQFGLAARGVKGLKAIVPVAGIASWYEYTNDMGAYDRLEYTQSLAWYVNSRFRNNAVYGDTSTTDYDNTIRDIFGRYLRQLRTDQATATGDYSDHWMVRDYTDTQYGFFDWAKIDCAALIVHGVNDDNVRTKQSDLMYQAMLKAKKPVKLILHQGAHITPNTLMTGKYQYRDLLNRWWSHFLYDVDNGIEDMDPVSVESNIDGVWQYYDSWDGIKDEIFKHPDPVAKPFTTINSYYSSHSPAIVANNFRNYFFAAETPHSTIIAKKLSESFTVKGAMEVTLKAAVDDLILPHPEEFIAPPPDLPEPGVWGIYLNEEGGLNWDAINQGLEAGEIEHGDVMMLMRDYGFRPNDTAPPPEAEAATAVSRRDNLTMNAILVEISDEPFRAYPTNSTSYTTVETGGVWMGAGLSNGNLQKIAQTNAAQNPLNGAYYKVIAYGKMDLANPNAKYDSHTAHRKDSVDLEPGKFYDYTLYMQPTVHTVRAGHTLALVIFAYYPGKGAQQPTTAQGQYTITIDNSSIIGRFPNDPINTVEFLGIDGATVLATQLIPDGNNIDLTKVPVIANTLTHRFAGWAIKGETGEFDLATIINKDYTLVPIMVERSDLATIEVLDVVTDPGGTVNVTYSITNNVNGFTTFDLELPYDRTICWPTAITPGAILDSGGSGAFAANPSYGGADIAKVTYANFDKIAGDGLLFTVTYQVAAGTPAVEALLDVNLKRATVLVADAYSDIHIKVKPGKMVIGRLGDVNGDGLVTPEDAMLLLQMIVGLVPWTDRALRFGDINGDGIVDTSDAALILRMVVGG
ncbi:MAG: dockerin type I domain-containing protein [Clostridiales bacterium]|nr:dockerin type I domain-containing protein [Clostridiales bacterium]